MKHLDTSEVIDTKKYSIPKYARERSLHLSALLRFTPVYSNTYFDESRFVYE